ncbi:MAG: large ribosomal subunit protein bL34 [Planctomycetota bacterium]|jgi:ribosomal protein L34
MKRNIRHSNVKKKRTGFRRRMKTKSGRKIVNARRKLRGTFP